MEGEAPKGKGKKGDEWQERRKGKGKGYENFDQEVKGKGKSKKAWKSEGYADWWWPSNGKSGWKGWHGDSWHGDSWTGGWKGEEQWFKRKGKKGKGEWKGNGH